MLNMQAWRYLYRWIARCLCIVGCVFVRKDVSLYGRRGLCLAGGAAVWEEVSVSSRRCLSEVPLHDKR